jgi:hypothetical protein
VETVVFIKAHELKATFRPTKKIYIDRYMRGAIREVVCTPYFDIWQRADGDFVSTLAQRFPNCSEMTESMCGMIAYITRIPKMRSCTAPKDKKILYLMAYSFGGIS